MKTLEKIQKLAKLGKILSNIFFIIGIIGAAGCIIGMISVPFSGSELFKLDGLSVYGLVFTEAGYDLNALYAPLAGILAVNIGQIVMALFAKKYFKNELQAGTPFTLDGTKELFRLGIITICVSIGALTLGQIICSAVSSVIGCGESFDIDCSGNISVGAAFLVVSLLCKYAAELANEQ